MTTPVLTIDPTMPDHATIARAADLIRAGGLVAFPTETVYGLGADATNAAAVLRIFAAKERDLADPLIVHVLGLDDVGEVAREVGDTARALAARFWPGPLTIVLPRADRIPAAVSGGIETVAVRAPSHPVAQALIAAAGVPIAAPSANRFMRTSGTTAAHVLEDLDGRIDLVLDGGPAYAGIESTVVAVDGEIVRVLRPGAITLEQIAEALPGTEVIVGNSLATLTASPGLMDRHYAPRTPLTYVRGPGPAARTALLRLVEQRLAEGGRPGVLAPTEDVALVRALGAAVAVEELGSLRDLADIAHNLFAAMRRLDRAGVDALYARSFGEAGLGVALDDRLRRAATQVIEIASE